MSAGVGTPGKHAVEVQQSNAHSVHLGCCVHQTATKRLDCFLLPSCLWLHSLCVVCLAQYLSNSLDTNTLSRFSSPNPPVSTNSVLERSSVLSFRLTDQTAFLFTFSSKKTLVVPCFEPLPPPCPAEHDGGVIHVAMDRVHRRPLCAYRGRERWVSFCLDLHCGRSLFFWDGTCWGFYFLLLLRMSHPLLYLLNLPLLCALCVSLTSH